jgi:hypothetical protein
MPEFSSNSITFVDITDSRKLDVYISSNLPTTQIYDSNTGTYSPDWRIANLQLNANIYLDSEEIIPETINWCTKINGTESPVDNNNSSSLTIKANVLSDNPIITYKCIATYQGIAAFSEVTFMRADTGKDGTSVKILGSYNTLTELQSAHPTGNTGDSYIVDGDLYVWATNNSRWENVGNLQGPKGDRGESAKAIILNANAQVFKVSKTGAISPSTITVVAQSVNTNINNWTYSTNGGESFLSTVPAGVSINGNTVTITGSNLTSNSIVIKASDGTYSDTLTIYKVFDGSDGVKGNDGSPAPIVFLTNENITFGANEKGQVSSTSFTTNVVAYNGTTQVVPTIGTITGLPTGMTLSSSTTSGNEVALSFTIANNSTLGSTSNNNGTINIPITSPIGTNLKLSWSKVNSGANGAEGEAGADAYTVILTNESHAFAGDIENAIAGSASTQVIAYKGSASQSVTIVSVNGMNAATTDTATGIAGLRFECSALSSTSPTITFTCTSDFKSANGSIPIVLSVDGVTFTKMFTYSIAFKGDKGEPGEAGTAASSYWLISSANVVQKTSTGTITVTPSTLTFTGKRQTGAESPIDYACRWKIAYSTDGTNYTDLYTSTVDEKSKSIATATTYKTMRVRMYMAGGTTTLLDEQIIPTVTDGTKGDTGIGINSVTVTYGVSTSASTQPTSWQASIPAVAEGSYLWTRTVTDYTDDTIPDTVTLTYAKQGVKGDTGSQGSSVTVSSIQYQAGTSATTAPTGTWSNNVVEVAEGSYLWTKTAFSDNKVAYGVAKQGVSGKDGVGINSTTVDYGVSDSATVKPTTWQQGIPVVAEGKYLWTRTVTDYTDTTKADTVTYVYAKQGSKGETGTAGTSVTVKSIRYQAGTSATTAPTGTWSDSVVAVAEGSYLWTQTTFSDNKIAYGVAKQGQKGDTGRGVSKITEYYLATTASSGVTTSTSGWTTTVQSVTSTNRYLWNYEVVTYTDNTTSSTAPIIIGVFGNTGSTGATGKGIKSVTEYYLATNSASGVTTSTSGWTPAMQTLTATKKYLWNYELITYTDNSTATINPVIIGAYGDKGNQGDKGTDAVTFQLYAPSGYLLTKDLSEITLQTFAYEGSVAITSGATYQWAQYIEDVWENISGATTQTLAVAKDEVIKSKSYKCTMTYKSKQYTATATVQDKTDIYDSLIQTIAKYSSTNRLYWVLYSTVYTEEGEKDKLLGPVSTTAPTSPTTGAYWYKIDETNYTVTLMKYSGTAWTTTTDKQELVYDWFLFNDVDNTTPLGSQNKVKIITSNDFNKICSVQCNIYDSESTPITYSNQILTDPSDPVVSSVEPINPVHGQLWIKTGESGLYTLLAWDASLEQWIVSETDSRVKVHISKPTSYEVGDVWVVGNDYEPTIYVNGVAQATKYLAGTLLKAQYSSQSYKDSDWVEALNYQKEIDTLKENLNTYNQFFSFDEDGLTMQAKNKSGVISEFKTKLTNTELGFYQGENKVAHINNNQLNISKAEITNGMTITGQAPMLEIGNFVIIQESNGSLSIGLKG